MRHLLFLLFLLTGWTGRAQYTFHTFDVKSGMSDNYVQSILRDQYGFMWFGTINGLNRYDGYHCKTYQTTPLGTYNNSISQVLEDAGGNIWIQTPERLFIYDRKNDRLDSVIGRVTNSFPIPGNIRQLQTDEEKNLWCIHEYTLYKYVYKEQKLYSLQLPKKKVMNYTSRKDKCYLLFEDGDIATANLPSKQLQTAFHLPQAADIHLYLDTQGRLWCYGKNRQGIRCMDTKGHRDLHISCLEMLKAELINSITDDDEGNIWIGTNSQGIFVIDKDLKHFSHLHSHPGHPFALPSNHISCFYKDDKNTIWVGTSKQGAAFAHLQNTPFEICRTPVHEDISCFQEDREGNIWIGFDGKGLLCYSPRNGRNTLYNTTQGNLSSDLIIGAYTDSKGRIWFGSYGNGLFFRENGRFVPVTYPTRAGEDSPIKFVRHLAEDNRGNLWIGTFNHGLYCMDSLGNFSSFTRENSCLRTHTITALAHLPEEDTLYVGTSTGLYKLDTARKHLAPASAKTRDGQSLGIIHIYCLCLDKRGLLWIGTPNGLLIYDRTTQSLAHLTTSNGLSHPRIRGMAEDHSGNLWVTTDKGITHIVAVDDPARQDLQFRCYPYYEEDGISNITFNAYSIYCTRKGEILAGGNGQYIKIHPDICRYQPTRHQASFTGLYVANQPINVGEADVNGRILLKQNIQQLDAITLDHSDVNFAIEVSSMDYLSQHKLKFAYRTNPGERWVQATGNRINFNRLAPGTYHLQVKVDEPNGENNPVSELTIRIRPPFWLSGPAYGLYILICLGLVVLYAHWSHKKHRRTLLQQKKEMEAAQQHEMDEAKLRFFTNISHDLRTPLSLIITPLEQLLKSDKAPEAKEELELIRRTASTLMNLVNQLLDFRKLDQHKAQYAPSYGNLSAFVASVCDVFRPLAQKSKITLELVTAHPSLEMNFDRNKMERILYNLLSNALKYNHTGGSITVNVDEIQTDGHETARIRVADTGIGIKDENKERIFERFFQETHTDTPYMGNGIGLHIVKEYVELHHGSITVEDNHPAGTIFSVLLPIDKSLPARQPADTPSEDNDAGQAESIEETDNNDCLLIVEDNDDFRNFLVSCLKDKYQVVAAENGQKALEILDRQTVNLIISDVMMPVMDGMELCRHIKHDIRFSHIPIILLTARTAEEHILGGLKEGADDYLTKPFNLDILLLRIQKLLAWTQENHRKFQTTDVSPADITVSTLDEELIGKAIRLMEQEMDNADFSVEEFSNRLGLSRSGLYKKLMQITGKSPLEFMRTLRLKRGKALLEKSGDSISQIAYQVGMSPKQFAKFFKEEFGYLPSDYKRQAAGASC